MKFLSFLCIFVFLFGISCNQTSNQIQNIQVTEIPQPTQVKEETYSTVSVKNYSLTLKNLDGKCVLFYKNETIKGENAEGNFALDFAAPCEFIRLPGDSEKVLFYTYGKTEKVSIIMITGGSTSSEFPLKDRLQPQGCGTETQKIRIFDNKIEKGNSDKSYTPICPTIGVDEVFYAA